jgi:protoporphyrin/coproporphyrin ferrochelatase
METRKALLLVNTGTPDSPDKPRVRRYLSEFLNDPFVIDLPWLSRKLLVNFIIVPFRTAKSAKLYRRLWTSEGSPLKINLERLVAGVREAAGNHWLVEGAMRYGNPSLEMELDKLRKAGVSELTILPLFPQYASSTTGSVKKLVDDNISSWQIKPKVNFICQFYSDPAFITAFAEVIDRYEPRQFDHILFSYHSLPWRHIDRVHPAIDHKTCSCETEMPVHGTFCYRAACFETTRLLTRFLNIDPERYSTSFQSRFSDEWMGPYTDVVLRNLASGGSGRVLVVAPSFVSDCLETIIEIGEEYGKLFREHGGKELILAESLNYSDQWVESVMKIITANVSPACSP